MTGAASKTCAMTGWRLGWAMGPPELVTAMTSYQSHTTSNASSISQAAALEALTDLDELGARRSRRCSPTTTTPPEIMVGGPRRPIAGVRCPMPEGAFYAFADVSALYAAQGCRGIGGFCDRLLTEAHVAAVPGDAFGEDALRALLLRDDPSDRIHEGVRRIAAWAAR